MSAATGDPKQIAQLNEILGRELGRNQYGDPYFTWRWSEDLYWPAFATGRTTIKETKVQTPIIGAPPDSHDFEQEMVWSSELRRDVSRCKTCHGIEPELVHNVYSIMQAPEPEYRRDRQMRKRDTWVICKWLTPWELILGQRPESGWLCHGEQNHIEKEPSRDALIAAWNRQFPGAAFPAKGWLIPTDAYLPAGPHDENWAESPFGHTVPQIADTNLFIERVRYQTSRPGDEVLADMLAREDAANLRGEAAIGEECRDLFPALLNPAPGKRGRASGGGFISFPWTKADRQR